MPPYRPGPVPLRIGDLERDRAAGCLQEHYAAGRLTGAEFDERLTLALAARTGADLARLFVDLPFPHPILPPDTPAPTLTPPSVAPPFVARPRVAGPQVSPAHAVTACVLAVLTLGYLLPWAVAALRDRRDAAQIGLLNLLLGWSGVGWVVMLVIACLPDQPPPGGAAWSWRPAAASRGGPARLPSAPTERPYGRPPAPTTSPFALRPTTDPTVPLPGDRPPRPFDVTQRLPTRPTETDRRQ
ncbi:MAG: DUF1707 domain-containing protein [Actinomycetes bacterium]